MFASKWCMELTHSMKSNQKNYYCSFSNGLLSLNWNSRDERRNIFILFNFWSFSVSSISSLNWLRCFDIEKLRIDTNSLRNGIRNDIMTKNIPKKEICNKRFVSILGAIISIDIFGPASTCGQPTFHFNRAPEHYLLLNLLRR